MFKQVSLGFLVFFGLLSLSYADSNGVWTMASDIRGGTFGYDEGSPEFVFNSTLKITKFYDLENSTYSLDLNGLSKFNDVRSNLFNTNSLTVNGDSVLNGNLQIDTTISSLSSLTLRSNSDLILNSQNGNIIIQLG